MGGKEEGGAGTWRGGWELRGEDGGAVQEGREHAKKGERGKKGRRGEDETRGKHVWGKRGKGREGHGETSRIVACSEDVQLEERVLHDLHRAVIGRQTCMKRLAARQCAAHESGLHVSDASLQLTLHDQ